MKAFAPIFIITLLLLLGNDSVVAQPEVQVAYSPFVQPPPVSFKHFREQNPALEDMLIISSEELKIRLDKKERITVLDARTQPEFEISHLSSARWVGYEDLSNQRIWMFRRDLPVVVYCTTGDRSKWVAAYLSYVGYKNVSILQEGIIGWANLSYPLLNSKNLKTEKVHIYEKKNQSLLKKGKSVY
jgi:rhodanese-related sulfurtransferase